MKGQLTIFYSYANHTGKKEAMVKKAQAESQKRKVLVAFLYNTGLPSLEGYLFDVEKVIEYKPDLVVIEKMAHVNPDFQRHHQRYQDIEELLNHGIDVYTTLNVSEIESLQEQIRKITGNPSLETIPDSIFDRADHVIYVDKEADENLQPLKELALRRLAERIAFRRSNLENNYDEHILVCLSSSFSNAKIIRAASRMARAFNAKLTALFVQTLEFQNTSNENKERLIQNQKLASQLGAHVETVFGDDVPFQIAEFARLSGVSKIVLGQSSTRPKLFFNKTTFAQQIMNHASNIEVHIIPDDYQQYHSFFHIKSEFRSNAIKTALILLMATLCSELFERLGFTDANIIMVYILGVLITSVVTTQRIYSLISSVASVIIFNFFFTTPRFSLTAYETGYPVTFVVMLLTAFITGTFANRYKEQASLSAKSAYRFKILFDTNQQLNKVKTKQEILDTTAHQIIQLLGCNVVLFDIVDGKLSKPKIYSTNDSEVMLALDEKELDASTWAFQNNHQAGATTDTMSDADYLYLTIRTSAAVYGVIGIEAKKHPLEGSENSILLSILGECALALENEKNAKEKEEAALLAQSEQLRANLLRSISHDLRTPLTSISGNASQLLSNGSFFDETTKHQIYEDIYNDSIWLTSLVENLLSATKLEEGKMQLKTSTELLNDIVDDAYLHMKNMKRFHDLTVSKCDEYLFVHVDPKLIIQVILNIVDNAMKYTPPNTPIMIQTRKEDTYAVVSISDHGAGISDNEKEKIFDKFYCVDHKIADNRRSLGLGLFLCKEIIKAHDGKIEVSDHEPHGTVFTFYLPLEEVILHE